MNKIACLTLSLTLPWVLASQTEPVEASRAIKVYNLSHYQEVSPVTGGMIFPGLRFTNSYLQVLHPTVAYQWKTRRANFQELELTHFMMGRTGTHIHLVNDSTGQTIGSSASYVVATNLAFRYEYQLNLFKSGGGRFLPSIALGVLPQYQSSRINSSSGATFPIGTQKLGVSGQIIPRLCWYLNDRFFLDVNVPLIFCAFSYEVSRNLNPAIPARQQTLSNLNFELIPREYSFRVGLGMRF